jgi:hypothetical protein
MDFGVPELLNGHKPCRVETSWRESIMDHLILPKEKERNNKWHHFFSKHTLICKIRMNNK